MELTRGGSVPPSIHQWGLGEHLDFSAAMSVSGAFLGGQYAPTTTHYFDGKVDEVRISNTSRTADWISASFNNQDIPSGFFQPPAAEAEVPFAPATGLNTSLLGVESDVDRIRRSRTEAAADIWALRSLPVTNSTKSLCAGGSLLLTRWAHDCFIFSAKSAILTL